ncbi:helix-turn-helix transcriptional regulator [Salmonella enterica]|nr:XRE family transcriptional regulator [Salmonella enterica]EBW1589851.1 XRE family transcriptional regulator [Salmonella enterica subsp. diarizonae serovar 61:r:z]EDR7604205.1 helix-turn-helix transcriptional regulator [Salmonella enterica subsp. diarizonae]EAT8026335.1 helix-turn-helix transcriptional regulator [Salmonella enterica]EBB6122792.1 helix-turn-helix transcriptional regulator [Salmonella enterica]
MSSIYSEQYQQVIRLLRSARQDRGLTQAQLAKALGRPQSFVAKVENGERRLDIIEFAHIAHLLSLDPADVLKMVFPQK